jgi:hypothetical protein
VGGHRNDISFNHNNYYNPDFYNRYPSQSFQTFKELFTGNVINNPVCPSIAVPYAWHTSEILYSVCNHTSSLGSLSIALSPELSDAAKAAADKAAADKAAADKAAADKAAADKAAADKAAADKAAADKAAADKAEIRNLLDSVASQISSLKFKYGENNVRVQQSTLDRLNLALQNSNESGYSEIRLLAQKAQADLLAIEQKFAKEMKILKKSTITCVKGKVSKKVTASNPKCPAGYKKAA